MTTFDDRKNGFENKFAHDEEIAFKTTALCNKWLGLWAAARMGKIGAASEAYANSIIEAEFATGGHKALEEKVLGDLTQAGIEVTLKDIQQESARLLTIAQKQLKGTN